MDINYFKNLSPLERRVNNLEWKVFASKPDYKLRKVGEVLGNTIYIKVSSNHSQDEADDIAYDVRQVLEDLHKCRIEEKISASNSK